MYKIGELIWWKNEWYILEAVHTINHNGEKRIIGRLERMLKEATNNLKTIFINFNQDPNHEPRNEMSNAEYIELLTEHWHQQAPETIGYVVCSMEEATHVVFSKVDLALAGEEGKCYTPNHVYPIQIEKESGEYFIINDEKDIVIGFDLFVPCEYLKRKTNHHSTQQSSETATVVHLADYIQCRKNKK